MIQLHDCILEFATRDTPMTRLVLATKVRKVVQTCKSTGNCQLNFAQMANQSTCKDRSEVQFSSNIYIYRPSDVCMCTSLLNLWIRIALLNSIKEDHNLFIVLHVSKR